ncbi:MAG: TRAM domain-containing protein [Synergistaceae bacterium]|nr:TRAM domain-containing protein [Synergistaceae bacterium]
MTEGFGKIARKIFSGLLFIVGGMIGAQIIQLFYPMIPERFTLAWKEWLPLWLPDKVLLTIVSVVVFAFIALVLAPLFLRLLGLMGSFFEVHLKNSTWSEITSATIGMIIGLLIANLMALPFSDLPFGSYLAVGLNIVLGYLGALILLKRQNDLRHVLTPIQSLKERLSSMKGNPARDQEEPGSDYSASQQWEAGKKILDTSVIIDGRILDVARTGFLEGLIIIPQFVLLELQAVADSTDPARRTRGRRGLDVVNELQRISELQIEIIDTSLKALKVETVDSGLVVMADKVGAQILTTDYNLNKLAQIQGIKVLNVNDLANALKPMLLPGETINIDVIREGKEPHQGVGYLDDGTMFVVEDGEGYIGKRVEVVVTSMLQTSAGRMVFGRVRREVRL